MDRSAMNTELICQAFTKIVVLMDLAEEERENGKWYESAGATSKAELCFLKARSLEQRCQRSFRFLRSVGGYWAGIAAATVRPDVELRTCKLLESTIKRHERVSRSLTISQRTMKLMNIPG